MISFLPRTSSSTANEQELERTMKRPVHEDGCGTRLRPLTRVGPKQLIAIANKPNIPNYFEDLREAGIADIGIILGNVMPEKVQELLGGGSKLGVKREVKDVKVIAASGSGRRFKMLEQLFCSCARIHCLGVCSARKEESLKL